MVTGKVPGSLAAQVKQFTKEAKEEILANINPYTTLIRIDVEPVAAGQVFTKCVGLRSFDENWTAFDFEAKEGEILIVNFWSSECEASIRSAESLNLFKKGRAQNLRIVNINVDENPEPAAAKIVREAGWDNLENYHVGDSNADLIYGTAMIPRVVITSSDSKVLYIGHPRNFDIASDIDKLLKGETIVREVEEGEVFIAPSEKGFFSEEYSLEKVKDEMERFSNELVYLSKEKQSLKGSLDGLFTDSIMVLRQSKFNPATEQLLTKYQLINMLAGPQQAVGEIRAFLEDFLATFGGSFEVEWEVTVIPAASE